MTTYSPAGSALDGGAMLGRHLAAFFAKPIPNMTLLNWFTDGSGKSALPFRDFNCSFECVHGCKSTKCLVALSTSSFVVTKILVDSLQVPL